MAPAAVAQQVAAAAAIVPTSAASPSSVKLVKGMKGVKQVVSTCVKGGSKVVMPATLSSSQGDTVQALSIERRAALQSQIDRLDDAQLDQVLEFLEPEVGGAAEEEEVTLDIDMLLPSRQHALVTLVESIVGAAPPTSTIAAAATTAPSALGSAAAAEVVEALSLQAVPADVPLPQDNMSRVSGDSMLDSTHDVLSMAD